MNMRAAGGAVLIVALVGSGFGPVAIEAQQQTGPQPPAGEDQKPATPPASQNTENDDLNSMPTLQSPADAEPAVSRNGNQRVYVENAFTGSTGRSDLLVPVPQSTGSTWED